jgi:hypothetical protein
VEKLIWNETPGTSCGSSSINTTAASARPLNEIACRPASTATV